MNQRWLAILLFGFGVGLGACSDDSDGGGGDGGEGGGSGGIGGNTGSGGSSGTGGRGGASATGGTGGTGGTEIVHCLAEDDMGAVTGCEDLTVPEPAVENTRLACENQGGTVVDACPSAGRIGRCALVMGTLVVHYYEPDDPVELEEMCTLLSGTWTSG
jgi:hypothetical protein